MRVCVVASGVKSGVDGRLWQFHSSSFVIEFMLVGWLRIVNCEL